MKSTFLCAFLALTMLAVAVAQEHLEPEPGVFAERDQYHSNVRELFAAAQADRIICQVVLIASFQPEQMIGLRKTATTYEIFGIRPTTAVWDTELVQEYESGQIGTIDRDGKTLPLEKDEHYQALKKRTPADFRQIKTEVKAVAVPEALAHRISTIWQRMLLATRYSKKVDLPLDGTAFHFSMSPDGRGNLGGQISTPWEGTKTRALAELALTMSGFAYGKTSLQELTKAVTRAEKLTKE